MCLTHVVTDGFLTATCVKKKGVTGIKISNMGASEIVTWDFINIIIKGYTVVVLDLIDRFVPKPWDEVVAGDRVMFLSTRPEYRDEVCVNVSDLDVRPHRVLHVIKEARADLPSCQVITVTLAPIDGGVSFLYKVVMSQGCVLNHLVNSASTIARGVLYLHMVNYRAEFNACGFLDWNYFSVFTKTKHVKKTYRDKRSCYGLYDNKAVNVPHATLMAKRQTLYQIFGKTGKDVKFPDEFVKQDPGYAAFRHFPVDLRLGVLIREYFGKGLLCDAPTFVPPKYLQTYPELELGMLASACLKENRAFFTTLYYPSCGHQGVLRESIFCGNTDALTVLEEVKWQHCGLTDALSLVRIFQRYNVPTGMLPRSAHLNIGYIRRLVGWAKKATLPEGRFWRSPKRNGSLQDIFRAMSAGEQETVRKLDAIITHGLRLIDDSCADSDDELPRIDGNVPRSKVARLQRKRKMKRNHLFIKSHFDKMYVNAGAKYVPHVLSHLFGPKKAVLPIECDLADRFALMRTVVSDAHRTMLDKLHIYSKTFYALNATVPPEMSMGACTFAYESRSDRTVRPLKTRVVIPEYYTDIELLYATEIVRLKRLVQNVKNSIEFRPLAAQFSVGTLSVMPARISRDLGVAPQLVRINDATTERELIEFAQRLYVATLLRHCIDGLNFEQHKLTCVSQSKSCLSVPSGELDPQTLTAWIVSVDAAMKSALGEPRYHCGVCQEILTARWPFGKEFIFECFTYDGAVFTMKQGHSE